MALQLGENLGRYQLEEQVGQGGMAVVYRAVDAVLGRTVAVKVIRPVYSEDSQFVERFLQEARLVAALDHPNILPVFDFGEERGSPYLVIPYLPAGTLAGRIGGKPQPLGRVAAWLVQLAGALDAAHAEGVLHRDLKPGNVLIGSDGRLVLGDFGIARLAEASTRLTATGMVVGTPLYMAPELARGADASPASDRYALGVVAYEMLAGRPPFQGGNPLSVLHQQVHEAVPTLAGTLPDLPRSVDLWLQRVLAKEPAQRPASARAMAEELVRLLTPEQRAELSTLVWTGGQGLPAAADGGGGASEVDTGRTLQLAPESPAAQPQPKPPPTGAWTPAAMPLPRSPARSPVLWALVAVGVLVAALLFLPRELLTGGSGPPGGPAAEPVASEPSEPTAPSLAAGAPPAAAADGVATAPPAAVAEAQPSASDGPPAADDAVAGEARLGEAPSAAEGPMADRLATMRPLRRPTRRLSAADFRQLAAETAQQVDDSRVGQSMAAAHEWALGGLAYAEGREGEARARRDALLARISSRAGQVPWGIAWPATAFRDQPWALATLYADARGELAGLLPSAPASGDSGGVALAGALLAHLDGDHAGALRQLGEAGVDPATSGGRAEARALVAQLVSIESIEAGNAPEAHRYRTLAMDGGRAPLVGPFLLESFALTAERLGPQQAQAVRTEACRYARVLCGGGAAAAPSGAAGRQRPGAQRTPPRLRRQPPPGGSGGGGG